MCVERCHALRLHTNLRGCLLTYLPTYLQVANQDGKGDLTSEEAAAAAAQLPAFGVDPALDIELTSQVLQPAACDPACSRRRPRVLL